MWTCQEAVNHITMSLHTSVDCAEAFLEKSVQSKFMDKKDVSLNLLFVYCVVVVVIVVCSVLQ